MSYWPPGLPDPKTGAAFTTAENRLMTEGAVSPRTRIVDPNYRQTLSLGWTMSETQYRVFESWHRHRLHDGISRFEVSWDNRQGLAQFTGPVQAQLSGAQWELTGEVLIDYA